MAIDLMADLDNPEVKPETMKSDTKKVTKKESKPVTESLSGDSRLIRLIDESCLPLCGDQVFWFQAGEIKNKPCPAIVNVSPDRQRVLSLTIFTVNGPIVKDGVKHLSVDASPRDRELYGGWAWNRDGKGI